MVVLKVEKTVDSMVEHLADSTADNLAELMAVHWVD